MQGFHLWQYYKTSEEAVIDFLNYVPWDENHFGVWSDKLASILIDIGSKIDSSFRNTLNSSYLDEVEKIQTVRKKGKGKATIKEFESVYNSHYDFSSKDIRIMTAPVLSLIKPWEDWAESKSPEWWKAYNEVKHDRFTNIIEATLLNVLNALGALFLNCIIIQDYQPYLVDIEIIKCQYTKEETKRVLSEKIEPSLDELGPVVAKSNLLGYFYEPRNEWDWNILNPDNILNY